MRAVGLCALRQNEPFDRSSSPDILGDGYRLKVRWVHARRHSAEMIQNETVRHGANMQFVGQAMDWMVAPTNCDAGVAMARSA